MNRAEKGVPENETSQDIDSLDTIVYQYNSKFLSMTYTTMEIKHEVNQ